jgi:hypothetical protein
MMRVQSVSVFVLQQFRKVFGKRGDYELREMARKLLLRTKTRAPHGVGLTLSRISAFRS